MAELDVTAHYTIPELGQRILDLLEAAGVDLDALGIDDLAPVDAFHMRGRAATEQLLGWVDIRPTDRVLDAGCGIGGTSRYLASTCGCEVLGIDLTASYCRVAEMLSQRVGLDDLTTFVEASALEIPAADASFDVVWTEHVQMNIADKRAFYGELHRVLKPGGVLAFHDIFAGPTAGLHVPVPWASVESISHLATVDELRDVLAGTGLGIVAFEDTTEASTEFFRGVVERIHTSGWMPLGIHVLMGETAQAKLENVLRNLEEGCIRGIQAVARRD